MCADMKLRDHTKNSGFNNGSLVAWPGRTIARLNRLTYIRTYNTLGSLRISIASESDRHIKASLLQASQRREHRPQSPHSNPYLPRA